MVFDGNGGTATGPPDGVATGAGATGANCAASGCLGVAMAAGFLVFLEGVALATDTFFRHDARSEELLSFWHEAALLDLAEPGLAVGVGVEEGMVSSWAKDGVAIANAARAAMPTIKRRIEISPGPLSTGDVAASIFRVNFIVSDAFMSNS